jgi:hypothetical protein
VSGNRASHRLYRGPRPIRTVNSCQPQTKRCKPTRAPTCTLVAVQKWCDHGQQPDLCRVCRWLRWPCSRSSFDVVTLTPEGRILGEFEGALQRLKGATTDQETMALWQTQPEAYAAATTNPEPACAAMRRFARWVRNLPIQFAALHQCAALRRTLAVAASL